MKKEKTPSKNRPIDQFQFHISPVSIAFSKKQKTSFYIYVQKGAQVLGKIDELFHGSNLSYVFQKHHTKRFRVASDKNLTYQWSLYKLTQDQQEEYLESVGFNIKNRFQDYIKEFEKFQNDLYRIYNEKQGKKELQEIWRDLRYDLTKNQIQLSCTFPKSNVKLTFKIKIKCQYDFMYEKWEQNKEKRKIEKSMITRRRTSMDSRNSRNKNSESSSVVEINQKNQQINETNKSNKKEPIMKELQIVNSKEKEEDDNIRQSQIRITNPEGVDVTTQIPEKFLNHRKTQEDDFYYRKRTSMLSDIIEQSYEGSSNLNMTKSNQGQKLKSVDIIKQQQEPLFSPYIKTQTFESSKHEEYFNGIKRTATLVQKTSQQYDLEDTPKASSKKSSQYFPNFDVKNLPVQNDDDREYILVSGTMKTSSRRSSQIEEQNKETIEDFDEAKKQTIKNVIKILLFVALLVFILNVSNIIGEEDQDDKRRQKPHKSKKNTIDFEQKTSKHKSSKIKS